MNEQRAVRRSEPNHTNAFIEGQVAGNDDRAVLITLDEDFEQQLDPVTESG